MADKIFIKRQIHHLVAANHAAKIKLLHSHMLSDWNCDCSYYKIWDAKQRVIGNIYGDWDESYETLLKFLKAVQDSNPGTEVHFANRDINNAGIVFFTVFFGDLLLALQDSHIVSLLLALMKLIFMEDMKRSY